MGRNKERKGRLDKGASGTSEFIGFSAFANTSSHHDNTTESNATSSSPQLQWSPVYAGSDSQLSLLFKKITQKRDSVTKARSLSELEAFFGSPDVPRKEQVSALCHLLFVYHNKLFYESSSAVRAAALSCLIVARSRVPKAWKTLWDQYPDLQGMVWCTLADRSAEVRAVAALDDGTRTDVSCRGLCEHVKRILGYGRARNMHDALFTRKTAEKGEQVLLSESEREQAEERFERIVGTALSGMSTFVGDHPQQEANNVVYEDYFSDGILWKTLVSSKTSFRRKTYELVATLCQYATAFVYDPDCVSALSKQLLNALAMEKDAVNMQPLLETLLLFLSCIPRDGPSRWEVVDVVLLCKPANKMLRKACYGASANLWGPSLLPLIASLPTTHHDDHEPFHFQRQLLSSMWAGRDVAIGPSDTLSIVSATAECSSFLLLRRQEDDTMAMDETTAKSIADFFLKALGQYLVTAKSTSSSRDVDQSLGEALARDVNNMETASRDRSTTALFSIQAWFWNKGVHSTVLDAVGPSVNFRVTRLVNCLRREQQGRGNQTKERSHTTTGFAPVLCSKFQSVLSQYQSKSGSVPYVDGYDLLIACLQYCGPRNVFGTIESETEQSSSMEQFLLNDLLRWIVIHASVLPTKQPLGPRDTLVDRDFTLLRICLASVPSPTRQQKLWESILREMVAAKCDLQLLATGIIVLLRKENDDVSNSGDWVDILRSNSILDELAIEAGVDAVQQYRTQYLTLHDYETDGDSEASDQGSISRSSFFFQTCVGLSPGVGVMVVNRSVVDRWIDAACPHESSELPLIASSYEEAFNPLLDTLLSLASHGDSLTPKEVARVAMEAWREGGSSWGPASDLMLHRTSTETTKTNTNLYEQLVSSMSEELKKLLTEICLFRYNDNSDILSMCHSWSDRAWRMIQLCNSASATEGNAAGPVSLLSLTGLADVNLWKSSVASHSDVSSPHLYLCLGFLLQHVEPQERLALLCNSTGTVEKELVVRILYSLSERDSLHNDSPTPVIERCNQLLRLLGGKDLLHKQHLQSWTRETVNILASDMRSLGDDNCEKIFRGVAVLSVLIGSLYDSNSSRKAGDGDLASELRPQDIHEGDTLWYISDKDNDEKREQVQIMKVHHDNYPLLYFTIRVQNARDKDITERQTVVERLRRCPYSASEQSSTADELSAEEETQREELTRLILENLVRPYVPEVPTADTTVVTEAAGECLNVIISQCGLPEKSGLGSTRYEVFKLVSTLDSNLSGALSSPEFDKAIVSTLLLSLASSMGFGRFTPSSRRNFGVMRYSPESCIGAVLNSEVSLKEQEDNRLDRAVLSWISVAISSLTKDDLVKQSLSLVYRVGLRLLERQKKVASGDSSYSIDSLLTLKAANSIQYIQPSSDLDPDPIKISVYPKLIESFLTEWECEAHDIFSFFAEDKEYQGLRRPRWHAPFSKFLEFEISRGKNALLVAATHYLDNFIETLFVSCKQWFAFRILIGVAGAGEQVCDDNAPLSDGTRMRLESWQRKLQPEEAEELEDDVVVVHRWLPERLMTELEGWADGDTDGSEHSKDDAAIGRMLSWLSFLSFLECAAIVKVTNRGAFSSYIEKCGTVGYILSSALMFANIENGRNAEPAPISVEKVLRDEDCLKLSQISTLVLFRSAEVLPTLFKDWWTDDCPKSLGSRVSQFVQNRVAPETLRRELDRIKKATDLGEMSVSGSAVSREVAASYVQDECQLSIVIHVPPNFPLRNVEVDGRKTLGIPEKRWKRWALQIRLMLNNQDGTILDALMLWKENVDKEFEGVEPCPVCYSVLSVKNHELPNLQCKTCENRFHSGCLYKWFQSSGKSQCVLCQQPWSGTRLQ